MRVRFARTAAFRLALVYAGVFALSAFLLIATFDWTVSAFASRNIDTHLADELEVLRSADRNGGPDEALEQVEQKQLALGDRQTLYLLTDSNGRRLAGLLPDEAARTGVSTVRWRRRLAGGARVQGEVFRTLGARLSHGGMAVVGISTQPYRDLRRRLLLASALSAAVMSLVAIGLSMLIGRQFLARVERVNRAAASIRDGRMDVRLPTIGMGEEFDQLADNLNGMLRRIESLMEGLRQVSSDIAHDLRTPLSRLRRQLETALESTDAAPERDRLAAQAIAQVDEILATFNALLRIGQLESGAAREAFHRVDLSELIERVRQAYEPVAEDHDKTFTGEIAPGVTVLGDEELLAQLLANLIENAMIHTGEAREIAVSLERTSQGPELQVADRGPGVPENERPKVVQRFFRLESSRTSPGAGLGLSMASAIAHLHGAELLLEDNHPGLKVRLVFAPAQIENQ